MQRFGRFKLVGHGALPSALLTNRPILFRDENLILECGLPLRVGHKPSALLRRLALFRGIRRRFGRARRGSGRHERPPVPKLKPAESAMVKLAAHKPFEQVQEPRFHGVDLVPRSKFGDPVGAASVASALAAEMKAVEAWKRFGALAFAAAILRHGAQAFEQRAMNPPQSAAAPATFLHSILIT